MVALMPPKVVGPYRILDVLGTGGVATVYRAVDRRSGEPIALKLLSTGPALDPRAARRLAREFETLSELSHPNVVRVIDTGVHQGYPYLAMELVEGLTLKQYLTLHEDRQDAAPPGPPPPAEASQTGDWVGPRFSMASFGDENPSEEVHEYRTGPESVRQLADAADEPDTYEVSAVSTPYELPPAATAPRVRPPPVDVARLNRPQRLVQLKDAMVQLCQAISYIHGHGLIHRDLKPSNVMVDEERVVRLMDFGLAKFLADDSAMTGTGRLVGTFRYMAPEQVMGEPVDPRTDLYSLGIILYELLAGRAPFEADTPHELWAMVLENEPPSVLSFNPGADLPLVRIAHRLIRKEADDRYQTAEEVQEALTE